jgi:hypothetical protein
MVLLLYSIKERQKTPYKIGLSQLNDYLSLDRL